MVSTRTRSVLWLALLVACGDPAAAPDAAVVDGAAVDGAAVDGGALDAGADTAVRLDAGLDAPACPASCDDADPATHDVCVVDRCEHRLCESNADCDDGDLETTDYCVLDAAAATRTCGHLRVGGVCVTDADCFDDVECTRDSCGTGDRCRHAWTPGCVAASPLTLRACPAGAVEGGECAIDPATSATYDCRVDTTPCSDWLRCIGNTFGTRYVRVETVRPGCDGGGCPTDLPSGACAPDLYCDYAPGDPSAPAPGRVYCDCWDRGNPTIAWSCFDDDPCPRTPPEDGAPVDHTAASSGASCPYGDYVCAVDVTTWTWSCATTSPTYCPMAAPATGEACVLASECRYYGPEAPTDPVTTYRGTCTCDGAHWACTPNESADCPAEQPNSGTLDNCSPTEGNRHCWYPLEGTQWTHCHCDPPSDPNLWTCEASAHY